MKIVKNKKKSWCVKCAKLINSSHKVYDNGNTFHLNCYRLWIILTLKNLKVKQIKLKKFFKLIEKYHKILLLESLEKNNKRTKFK